MSGVSSVRLFSEETAQGRGYLLLVLDRHGDVLARGHYGSVEEATQAIVSHFSAERARELPVPGAPHAAC